jgi:DNA mismatch repair protein MutL
MKQEPIPSSTSQQQFYSKEENTFSVFQLHQTYIVTQKSSGFVIIHQQNAHERVLYEKYTRAVAGSPIATQQSLFPSTIELSPADALLVTDMVSDLKELGYQLEPFGQHTFIIQGTPADVISGNEKNAIENIIEQYKHFSNDLKFSKREKLLRSMAMQNAIKPGTTLSEKEMMSLVNDLFACETANATPNGKPTFMRFDKEEMDKMFGK